MNGQDTAQKKQNCWEFKQCERQPGGKKEKEICTCPAGEGYAMYNEENNGIFCGRCCWKIAGTLCTDEAQEAYAKKIDYCRNCDFYKMVKEEEGEKFLE